MVYTPIAKLHELYDGYRRVLRHGGREWLLLQEAGQVYLIANRCPHMDAPLHKASIHNGLLRCPLHRMEFDLRSGKPLGSAAVCVASLEFRPVVYQGNTLGII